MRVGKAFSTRLDTSFFLLSLTLDLPLRWMLGGREPVLAAFNEMAEWLNEIDFWASLMVLGWKVVGLRHHTPSPRIGINFPVQLDIVGLRPIRITSSSSPESYFGFTY